MRAQIVSLVLLALLAGAQATGSITVTKSASTSVHDILAAKGIQITKTVTPAPAEKNVEAVAVKAEAPNVEAKVEKKVEAPKQEAAKQEAPKQEAAKQEAPKQAAPQQAAPKKAEAAKVEKNVQDAPVQKTVAVTSSAPVVTKQVEGTGGVQKSIAVNAGHGGFSKSVEVTGRRLSFFFHGGKTASVSVGKGGVSITKSVNKGTPAAAAPVAEKKPEPKQAAPQQAEAKVEKEVEVAVAPVVEKKVEVTAAKSVEVQKTAAVSQTGKSVTFTKTIPSFTKSVSISGGKGAEAGKSLSISGRKLSMLGKGVTFSVTKGKGVTITKVLPVMTFPSFTKSVSVSGGKGASAEKSLHITKGL